MKMYLLLFSVGMLVAVPLYAQPIPEHLRQELSTLPNGESLYPRSEVLRWLINARLALKARDVPAANIQLPLPTVKPASVIPLNQNEPTIAISRLNPNVIIAGSNDIQTYYSYPLGMPSYVSTDTGKTWTLRRLPVDSGVYSLGDPMIAADDRGGFYYVHLGIDTGAVRSVDFYNFISNIYVNYSTDGMNWLRCSPVVANKTRGPLLEDKEAIAVDTDPRSPYYGRIYVAWQRFDLSASGGDAYLIAWSDDYGKSWSSPRSYEGASFVQMRVGAFGKVYIAGSDDNTLTHILLISDDGGNTFERRPITAFEQYPMSSFYYTALKGDFGFRASPYVSFDVDPSIHRIHVVYGTYEDTVAQLKYVTSTDNGSTWSPGVRLGTKVDHFFPWVSHDLTSGRSYACFYGSDEQNKLIRFYRADLSRLQDAEPIGKLFDPLLDTTFLRPWLPPAPFIGDYVMMDSYKGIMVTAWCEPHDTNPNDPDIHIAVAIDSNLATVIKLRPNIENSVYGPLPNPAGEFTVFNFDKELLSSGFLSIELINDKGVLCHREIVSSTIATINLQGQGTGVFLCRVRSGNMALERKLIVLR